MSTQTKVGHTPGPWEIDFTSKYQEKPCIRHNGLIVCYFPSQPLHPEPGKLNDERIHDARLIAAAPELLEALKWAMDWRQLGSRWNLASDEERAKLDAARTAIAKAEGRRQ